MFGQFRRINRLASKTITKQLESLAAFSRIIPTVERSLSQFQTNSCVDQSQARLKQNQVDPRNIKQPIHNPKHTDRQVENGLANVYICDENRLGERDIAALVNEFDVEAEGKPDVVFVDYLGYFARGARGNSPYEKVSNAVMQLKAEAKAGRFVIISPSQVNRGAKEGLPIDLDDARDAGAVEETADFRREVMQSPMSTAGTIGAERMRYAGKGWYVGLSLNA